MFNSQPLPDKTTFYYKNKHGRLIALSEEIAAEQHKLHTYIGNSEDLKALDFSAEKAIEEALTKNADKIARRFPKDERKQVIYRGKSYNKEEFFGQQKGQQTQDIDALVNQKVAEALAKMQNESKDETNN
jgi:hypothetical protein